MKEERYYAVVSVREAHSARPVAMAKGKHLFPSRTQQLSPSAPMVLGWTRPGRVGRCRLPKEERKDLSSFFVPLARLCRASVRIKTDPVRRVKSARTDEASRASVRIKTDRVRRVNPARTDEASRASVRIKTDPVRKVKPARTDEANRASVRKEDRLR